MQSAAISQAEGAAYKFEDPEASEEFWVLLTHRGKCSALTSTADLFYTVHRERKPLITRGYAEIQ